MELGPRYIFRIDDVCEGQNAKNFASFRDICSRHGVFPLAAVIPKNKDTTIMASKGINREVFFKEIRQLYQLGWDIGIHGFEHNYISKDSGLLRMNRYSEFAGCTYKKQREKLLAAKRIFRTYGLPTTVFVAPAHSFDLNTIRAAHDCGIKYISDGLSLYPQHLGNMWLTPVIASKATRYPLGIITICLHLNKLKNEDFQQLERFMNANKEKITSFREITQKLENNEKFFKIMNTISDGYRYYFWLREFMVRKIRQLVM